MARDDASQHCGRRPWCCCEKLCACNRADHCPCPHRHSSGRRRLHSYTALTMANRHFSGFPFVRRRRLCCSLDSVCYTLTGQRTVQMQPSALPENPLEAAHWQYLLKSSSLPGPAIFTHAVPAPQQRSKIACCAQRPLNATPAVRTLSSETTVPTLRQLCSLTPAQSVLVCLWCLTSWAPHLRVHYIDTAVVQLQLPLQLSPLATHRQSQDSKSPTLQWCFKSTTATCMRRPKAGS